VLERHGDREAFFLKHYRKVSPKRLDIRVIWGAGEWRVSLSGRNVGPARTSKFSSWQVAVVDHAANEAALPPHKCECDDAKALCYRGPLSCNKFEQAGRKYATSSSSTADSRRQAHSNAAVSSCVWCQVRAMPARKCTARPCLIAAGVPARSRSRSRAEQFQFQDSPMNKTNYLEGWRIEAVANLSHSRGIERSGTPR